MPSRRTLALSAVLALAVAALPAGAAGAKTKPKPRCEAAAGDTIVRTSTIRVFQTVTVKKSDHTQNTARLYSCKIRSKKIRHFETFRNTLDGTRVINDAEIGGGRWLVISGTDITGTDDAVVLLEYDLRTGKRVATLTFDETSTPPEYVVTADGTIGTLEESGRVIGFDSAGRGDQTATGGSELAASKHNLYYVKGATSYTVMLHGHPAGDLLVAPVL